MGELEDPFLLNDLALADSFINFDYVPDPASDPNAGFGSPHSGRAGDCGIEEAIEKISLVETEGKGNGEVRVGSEITADVESKSLISENADADAATTLSSIYSGTGTGSDSGENGEVEEGEILDSDDDDSEESSEEMASWGVLDDDDDDDGGRPVISKNELEILPWVPPVNVTLGPHHQMLPVGVVMSILGAQVIVEGVEKHDPLNEGSILWMTERRRPLGLIDEIFGPVKNPYYIVRYNSEDEVPEDIRGGTLISSVPEFANHVLNNEELYKKGYDEENSDEAEFSDDEKEAEHKRMQTRAKRGVKARKPGKRRNNKEEVPSKDGFVPTLPVVPATSLPDHVYYSSVPGTAQGHSSGCNVNPPCPPNVVPNLTTSGVWTNGTTLPQQQFAVPPNGFPTNGVSWYPGNTQISRQFPSPGVPFQQQSNPFHGFPDYTQISHQVPVPGVSFQQQLNPVHGYPDNTQISHQVPAIGVPFQQQLNPVHGYPDNTQISHPFPAPGVPLQQQLNLVHGYPDNTQISRQLPVPGIPFQQQLNPLHGCPDNTPNFHQFPVPGTQFQQQLNPVHGFPPASTSPGIHPNIFAQPMYDQRPVNQNQITPGLSTPSPHVRSPINMHSSFVSGNQHAPHQFIPGASANHGRKTCNGPSKKGWRDWRRHK